MLTRTCVCTLEVTRILLRFSSSASVRFAADVLVRELAVGLLSTDVK